MTSIKAIFYSIVGMLIVTLILFTCNYNKKPAIAKENKVATIGDTINYKDLYKAAHFRVVQLISENAISKTQIDSLTKRLSVKPKQINKQVKTKVEIPGGVAKGEIKIIHDTVNGISHDVWVAEIDDHIINGVATIYPDSGIVKLEYNPIIIELEHIEIWKRRRLFGLKWTPRLGRKIFYIDAYSTNPLIHIIGLESYQLNN